jgi:ankyrin repeat protein
MAAVELVYHVQGLPLGPGPPSHGWTELHRAAHEDSYFLFQHLEHKEARTLAGNTALHLAVKAGHTRWLSDLTTPTTLDSQNNQGFTPLQLALIHRQWKAACMLVAAGASLYNDDAPDSTPSLAAADEDAPDLPLQLLKGMLADRSPAGLVAQALRWKDVGGSTALHGAACMGRLEEVCRLLRAGADMHEADAAGATPAVLAQQHGHMHLVPLLDPATSSVEMYGTPLHVAAERGDAAAVAAQLAAGAQPDSYALGDTSILGVAAQQGHTPVVAVLLAALAKKCDLQQQLQQQQQQQPPPPGPPLLVLWEQPRRGVVPPAAKKLAQLVAAALVPLGRQLEDACWCAQLLGVVLDVLGPEVTGYICEEMKEQLQREYKQRHNKQHYTEDEVPGHENHLAEALLLGCLGAEARRLVPGRLQRLVPGVATATNQQQQKQAGALYWQQMEVSSWVEDSISSAVSAARDGRQQDVLANLAGCAELYLQQQGRGLASSTMGPLRGPRSKPTPAHGAAEQLQPPPALAAPFSAYGDYVLTD